METIFCIQYMMINHVSFTVLCKDTVDLYLNSSDSGNILGDDMHFHCLTDVLSSNHTCGRNMCAWRLLSRVGQELEVNAIIS